MSELELIIALFNAGFTGRTYKPLTGREGPGFEYKLLRHGKPVATVTNWGDGGPTDERWTNEFAAHEFGQLIKRMPKFVSKYGELTMTEELALGLLAEAVNAKRSFKKKTVFYADGEYMAANALPSPTVVQWVSSKHPGAVLLNDHPAFQ